MTCTSRWPCWTIAWSAGKTFLWARSPVAPKNTNASGWGAPIVYSWKLRPQCDPAGGPLTGGLFVVSAELEAHRREQLVREVGLTPRGEALVQRRGEHGRRHGL